METELYLNSYGEPECCSPALHSLLRGGSIGSIAGIYWMMKQGRWLLFICGLPSCPEIPMGSGSVGTLRNSWDPWFHSPVPLMCVREESWLSQGHIRHVSVSKPRSAPDTTHNTHTKPVWSTVRLNDFYGGYRKSIDKVCFEHSFMSSSSFELLTDALAALQS